MNISLLTIRCAYFDVGGRGINALKHVFHRYLRRVCVNGALEQAERKSDTRSEKKLLPLNALPGRALLLRFHVSVSGALSPSGTCYESGAKQILHKLLIKTSYFQEIVYISARKC